MDIIFTTYFSRDIGFSQHDSSKHCVRDNYAIMARWYESLISNNLYGIIFHNELSRDFTSRYECEHVKFYFYDGMHRPSYNDERFYCYRQYLDAHPEYDRIFCTDLFDVEFFGNPFAVFTDQCDLYLGSEKRGVAIRWLQAKLREAGLPILSEDEMIYNAGIIGGRREAIYGLIIGVIKLLDKIQPHINANTPAYLHYTNRVYTGRIFTGYPLHNEFRSYKSDGIIKHK